MRYRYKPVFDGDELIAFAYWTGKQVAHYYIKPFICVSELPHAPMAEDEPIVKSLDGITLKDSPKEVQATHRWCVATWFGNHCGSRCNPSLLYAATARYGPFGIVAVITSTRTVVNANEK
jgi:hypothetical protein